MQKLLTVVEAAKTARRSKNLLYLHIKAKKLHPIRRGRIKGMLIAEDELERWIVAESQLIEEELN